MADADDKHKYNWKIQFYKHTYRGLAAITAMAGLLSAALAYVSYDSKSYRDAFDAVLLTSCTVIAGMTAARYHSQMKKAIKQSETSSLETRLGETI